MPLGRLIAAFRALIGGQGSVPGVVSESGGASKTTIITGCGSELAKADAAAVTRNGPRAAGSRSVAIAGDADRSVVVTGDGTVINMSPDGKGPSSLFQLPAGIGDFAGREAEVDALLRQLSQRGGRAAITAIAGMPGVGKTALAVHVGHRLAERYTDGQLFLNLHGMGDNSLTVEQALGRLIGAFDPARRLPENREELGVIYRDLLHEKQVLIVLDNARDGDQVAQLVPPESCGLIVTSRRSISGIKPFPLDLMHPDEAVSLLRSILGSIPIEPSALLRLAELCGRLPLALRVAGTFLVENRHWSVAEYIDALSSERDRLGRLRVEGNAELDVAVSLSLSIRELRRQHLALADRWHELAVFTGNFDLAGVAAVWEQTPAQARDTMTPMLARSMVLYDPASERYRLHDLMRDLAAGRAALATAVDASEDLAARLDQAALRHARHYCEVLSHTNQLYLQGRDHVPTALGLFDRERGNIEAGQGWAASRADANRSAAELLVRYPNRGADVLALRRLPWDRIRWLEAAVGAARAIGDRRGEGHALGNLGIAYSDLSDTRRAIECYEQDLVVAREIGDRAGESASLGNLGIAYKNLGDARRAIGYYERQLAIVREIGHRRGEGNALGNLGNSYAELDDARRAIEHYEQQLVIVRDIGDRRGECHALGNMGVAYRNLGEPGRGIEHLEQCLVIAREIGDRLGESNALGNLGIAYAKLSRHREAIEHYGRQLVIVREIGHRRGEGNALGNMGLSYADLGEPGRAIEHFERQLVIVREIGHRRSEGNALGNLGLTYSHLGDTRRAIEHYEQGLAIFVEIESPRAEVFRRAIARLLEGDK